MIGISDSNQKIIGNGLVINMDFSQFRTYPGTGTALTDISGSGLDATMVGTVGYTNTDPKSFNYSGTGNYFNGNNNLSTIITSGLTIISWINVTNITARSFIFAKYLSTNPPGYSFEVGTLSGLWTNTLRFYVQGTTANSSDYRGVANAISQNTKCMVSVTFDYATKTTAMYVNGSSITATQSGNPASMSSDWYNTNTPYKIATLRPSFALDAAMNQYSLFVYNRALTATEILNNYNATKSRFGL